MSQNFSTEITRSFNIRHPILLAGMNAASGPTLAAAVCNAGGMGVIGGLNYTPKMLRMMISELKAQLIDKNAPFGVDLLLPKVGEGARKTNYDYTHGHLDELIDIIIEENVKLFVSAVGVPSKEIVLRLHSAGIFVMNMVGSPKHVEKALEVGVDILCAQGGEGGGHTGDIGTMVLIPAVVDAVKGRKSPLTGRQIQVIGAGGIYDGRTLVAALSLGASAVWVGTRFVASVESSAPDPHKQAVIETQHDGTVKTLVFSGRPLRISDSPYAKDWETVRREKMLKLLSEGVVPANYDLDNFQKGEIPEEDIPHLMKHASDGKKPYPHLMGQVCGSIKRLETAKEIVDSMIREAQEVVRGLELLLEQNVVVSTGRSKL
ncbi:2-nitropropane dioxygenase [Yasminevirus sp. GU-2018]|uniref:2-nitropropane dioxygenase n=1 Tax=Yasminevirus sp. GU-2018 TaxID=2420051 RepID=A0A5K0U7A9_9VIRU|nr:2-nitropropane dioxygenase [Yasminevirus sp. GU-2018]